MIYIQQTPRHTQLIMQQLGY
uniref:Uncharacterized protein n=1 Tax=Arundo donax TaxID=35708 RepID=A0A0A9GP29_ARUDO